MKLLLVGALCAVTFAKPQRYDANEKPVSRIVGGEEVNPPGKYPFFMTVGSCGGSLISRDWVLTAGHCVDYLDKDNLVLYAGRHLINTGGIPTNAAEIILHPEYIDNGIGTNWSDTALIRISPPIITFKPVALDSGNGIYSNPGEDNTVIGFGLLDEYGSQPTTLQEVTLPVVSNEVCNEAMKPVAIGEKEICMGRPEGGQDACTNDSGGPMFHQNNGDFVQTGVVSWGNGCARPNNYGVYARVSSVIEFVKEHVPDAIIV